MQYCFLELIPLWFHSVALPSSFMQTGDELKHLGYDALSIKATSMQSTGDPLFGVDETSALHSSWLSLECLSLDHSEPWFEPMEGHLFGVLFLLL